MEIIAIAKAIPDVVWSGLLASFLTLSGVLISNWSNTKRLKIQLLHDADEKATERTFRMRQEVYLQVVDELVRLNAFLASLPQQDLAKGNFGDGFVGFQAAAARLQLVAEPNTALLAQALSARYGELFVDIMKYIIPIGSAKSHIQISDDIYKEYLGDVKRLNLEMTQMNETGKSDPLSFEAKQRSQQFFQEQAKIHSEKRSAAWTDFNEKTIAFQRYLFPQIRELAPQQIKLAIEVRRDLGLHGDLSEIEQQMVAQFNRMEAKFEELIATVTTA